MLRACWPRRSPSLPPGDPLRAVAEAETPQRLPSVTGWKQVGQEMWNDIGASPPMEPLIPDRLPPWEDGGDVQFRLSVGHLPIGASDETKRETALHHLQSLPQCATWMWSDGSADAGVYSGGAGALIVWPDDEREEVRAPAGRLCSSFRAEMVALHAALTYIQEHPAHESDPIVICTDSQSALAALREGPSAQSSSLGASIWRLLAALGSGGRAVHLQWIPSHCGIPGNEAADALARDASTLPQDDVAVDVRTIERAAARTARARYVSAWPKPGTRGGWYRQLMGAKLPRPVTVTDRSVAVDIHQIRAGHWSASLQYQHRIGLRPIPQCHDCNSHQCPAAFCMVCREPRADTPRHVLLECSASMGIRFSNLLTIHPTYEEVRGDSMVATLAAAFRAFQSRSATSRPA